MKPICSRLVNENPGQQHRVFGVMDLFGEFTYHYFILLCLWVITNDFEN